MWHGFTYLPCYVRSTADEEIAYNSCLLQKALKYFIFTETLDLTVTALQSWLVMIICASSVHIVMSIFKKIIQ